MACLWELVGVSGTVMPFSPFRWAGVEGTEELDRVAGVRVSESYMKGRCGHDEVFEEYQWSH